MATLATAVTPAAGLLMALVLATAGSTALTVLAARQPGRPLAGRSRQPARDTPWSAPGFPALILAFILVGAALTMIDLDTVAFAARHHAKPVSGLVLAAIYLASAACGLWYGSRPRYMAPQNRLPAALSLLTCGMLPFAVAPDVWFLFPAALLLGITIAPAIITGFSIVGPAVPEGQVTEAMTWVTCRAARGRLGRQARLRLRGMLRRGSSPRRISSAETDPAVRHRQPHHSQCPAQTLGRIVPAVR